MTTRLLTVILAIITMAAASVMGAKRPVTDDQPAGRVAHSAETVQMDVDDRQPEESSAGYQGMSLGSASSSSIAPGVVVGYTWYDQMHNGSMGRMIDWGINAEDGFRVHMSWMYMPDPIRVNRKYAYNAYDATGDSLRGVSLVQPDGEYAGYVVLDVTNDNRAVLGGHNNRGSGTQAELYWQTPGFTPWGASSRVPDSVAEYGGYTGQLAMWPRFRYQDVPGQTPITHVFAHIDWGEPQSEPCMYFRKVGNLETGDWAYPPYVVDTVPNPSQDITCSDIDGKVALVWTAMLPEEGDCDTCSYSGWNYFTRGENDVYYQISYDYGVTFEPRVNLTRYEHDNPFYRAFMDVSALIDSDNDLHIAFNARVGYYLKCRMFHWGENLGIGGFDGNGDAIFTTAANLEWDQTICNGGVWQLNGSKMTLSECDGKLYYLWTQFNDIPNGIEDDCHERAWGYSDVHGSANGELFLAVSSNGGVSWDRPRNLTNTFTPHCDSVGGVGGRCQSEHWASMAPFGIDFPVTGSNVEVIDPSGSYAGDWFLDVQYIDDADPGSIAMWEGMWSLNDVRWFRMACVEPVPWSTFEPSLSIIDYPAWINHGATLDTQLVITNSGNVSSDFAFTIEEDAGPYTGWLSLSPELQGTVSIGAGPDNTVTGTVTINSGGVVNDPGTVVHLGGRLIAVGNQLTTPDTLPIDVWVTDSMHIPIWDTISTGCLALTVSNHGNFGNQGIGKVNMDFFNCGDCDDLEPAQDTIPGHSAVYLNDASPVICWTDEFDTVRCNWSIYGDGFTSGHGFLPMGHNASVPFFIGMSCDDIPESLFVEDAYLSQFATRDTGIMIDQWWIHPNQGPFDKGANWIIQILRFTSADGQTHTGLNIGEAIDWDIPSDSAVRNFSGFDASNRLVYQGGTEYNEDPEECQDNNDRYGGIALVKIAVVEDGSSTTITDPYSAWTGSNSLWVFPTGGFVPEELDSLMTAREGYVLSDSLDADLHSVMTFVGGYTLTPTKELWVFKCLITSRLGYAAFIGSAAECHSFYHDNLTPPSIGCCIGPIRGNVDYDAGDAVDISDLVYLVDYMFTGGPAPPCFGEANIDGLGEIDISDLVYLVDYMFTGGPAPPACACCG